MRIRKKKNLSPYNVGRRCRCPTLLFSIVIWDLFVYWALDMRFIGTSPVENDLGCECRRNDMVPKFTGCWLVPGIWKPVFSHA